MAELPFYAQRLHAQRRYAAEVRIRAKLFSKAGEQYSAVI